MEYRSFLGRKARMCSPPVNNETGQVVMMKLSFLKRVWEPRRVTIYGENEPYILRWYKPNEDICRGQVLASEVQKQEILAQNSVVIDGIQFKRMVSWMAAKCNTQFPCDGKSTIQQCRRKHMFKNHPDKGGDDAMFKVLENCT